MFPEKNLTIRMPLVGGREQKAVRWLTLLTAFRAWLFLAILLVAFELWAECVYHGTFLFNVFNIQSIAVC
jgi:ribose transport system permease protein